MRIACTLEALLRVTPDTAVLIDDYVDRNDETVPQFADLIGMHGRMVELRKQPAFDRNACDASLSLAYGDLE